MEEDESFDEFYAKLKEIVNSAFNLRKTNPELKIVRNVLKSLPERFHAKITAIEESKDIDKIHLTKTASSLARLSSRTRTKEIRMLGMAVSTLFP